MGTKHVHGSTPILEFSERKPSEKKGSTGK
jgi:hypothetical protein